MAGGRRRGEGEERLSLEDMRAIVNMSSAEGEGEDEEAEAEAEMEMEMWDATEK